MNANEYERRYRVAYRWRRDVPNGPQNDWRSWRHFAHVPLSFETDAAAWEYIRASDPFKNLRHCRKISCSVEMYMRPVKREIASAGCRGSAKFEMFTDMLRFFELRD